MPIELSGMSELLSNLEKLGGDMRRAKIGALRIGSKILQDEMIARAKFTKGYSRGELAKHILTWPDNNLTDGEMSTIVGVSPEIPYAAPVEHGSSKQSPQPYAEPAVIAKRQEVIRAMADRVQLAITHIQERGNT